MINLLPKNEKEFLKKGLKLRLVIVSSFLLSASFLIGFIMLLPSYFLASNYFSKTVFDNSSLGLKNDDSIKKIINLPEEINLKLSLFQTNTTGLSAADYFSKIVEFLPSGVRLNSISFGKDQKYGEEKGTVIVVSGVSADRSSLVLFSTLLKKSNPQFTVNVPVSSLTKDKNLPFSMNIFIKN